MKQHRLLLLALALIQTTTTTTTIAAAEVIISGVEYNSTKHWSIARHIYRFSPLVVQSNGSLFHVLDSDEPEHAIHVYSSDYGLCKVSLKLNFHQRYPRHAVSLGNGKIVIWMLNYRLTHDGSRVNLHEAKWRFVVVEPRKCITEPSILAIRDSELDSKPVDVVDVVAYHDRFEVFLNPLTQNDQKNIYGFGYYDNGVPIRKQSWHSVIADGDLYSRHHPNTLKIHTVLKHDSSDGYFYLKVKAKPQLTLIKRFDANFQSNVNVTLQKSNDSYERFDGYSVAHGNLTYCRHTRRHLHCTFLDSTLRTKINLSLDYQPYVDYFSKIGRLSVSNTADGGALLFVAVESNSRVGPPLYVQFINADGQINQPIFIGRFFCEIHYLSSHEMPDGSHCICVVCDEIVHTRCFEFKLSTDDTNNL